jgi:hypothetical protein
MTVRHHAHVTDAGLLLNGVAIDREIDLATYQQALGPPSSTISAGGPAPVGHRNNQIHLYDDRGIYLTEHHATRLIGSINFVFECRDAAFSVSHAYDGELLVGPHAIRRGMHLDQLAQIGWKSDLPGSFHVVIGSCWIGAYAAPRLSRIGREADRTKIVWVRICPGSV